MENAQVQIRKGSWSLLHCTWAGERRSPISAPCSVIPVKERKRRVAHRHNSDDRRRMSCGARAEEDESATEASRSSGVSHGMDNVPRPVGWALGLGYRRQRRCRCFGSLYSQRTMVSGDWRPEQLEDGCSDGVDHRWLAPVVLRISFATGGWRRSNPATCARGENGERRATTGTGRRTAVQWITVGEDDGGVRTSAVVVARFCTGKLVVG
jgi:hypothetical protein